MVARTVMILIVSWLVLFIIISLLMNDYGLLQWGRQYAAVATVLVFFGYWFVHTGRLAKMFRKVE
jgi:hypothetical protein